MSSENLRADQRQAADKNLDSTLGEQAKGIDAALDVQLSPQLAAVRDRMVEAFSDLEVLGFRGELTLITPPELIVEVLRFAKDDPQVSCELLADLSAVHFLGGKQAEVMQETTGWPVYETEQPGVIEVDYILYSVAHNHRFRLRVALPDVDPAIDTATGVYASANIMEREVYDFFGVHFAGHPKLERILMPEDWEGYPLRKDYPLGGVDVQFKGATIPPPDQRTY